MLKEICVAVVSLFVILFISTIIGMCNVSGESDDNDEREYRKYKALKENKNNDLSDLEKHTVDKVMEYHKSKEDTINSNIKPKEIE